MVVARCVIAKYGVHEMRMDVEFKTAEDWDIYSRKYFIMAIFCGISRANVFDVLNSISEDIKSVPACNGEHDMSVQWRGNYNAKVSRWFQAVMYCNNYDLFANEKDGIELM